MSERFAPGELRAAVEAELKRDPDQTCHEVAARVGARPDALYSLRRRYGWRFAAHVPRVVWTDAMLDELERLARSDATMQSIAERIGVAPHSLMRGLRLLVRRKAP